VRLVREGAGEGAIAGDRQRPSTRVWWGPGRVIHLGFWLGIAAFPFLLVAAILYLIVQDSVNTQLGFDYATPRVSWNDEPFLISRVDSGGVMASAGLREDDRVRLDDVSSLYALLIHSQGGTASIPIERDGRASTVVVRVPRMTLPLSAGLRRFLYGRYWAEMCRAPRAASAALRVPGPPR
jgi:hypothetical protein